MLGRRWLVASNPNSCQDRRQLRPVSICASYRDLACARCSCSIAQQSKDWILDLVGVIQVQASSNRRKDRFMRVF